MLIGFYLLLYVGGLMADEQYNLLAAEGDSDVALPPVVTPAQIVAQEAVIEQPRTAAVSAVSAASAATAQPLVVPTPAPKLFQLPQLNNPGGGRELSSLIPAAVAGFGPNTVTRIEIPKIKVDRKIVEVGWSIEDIDGQQVAIWDVAKYAVGHHTGSANPGQPGNIVMAGHSGGRAYPFNDLYYLKAGDNIILWSNGQQYQYTVQERLVLDELGPTVTTAQRRANAQYIEPTKDEVATLITCWPLTGPTKFTQRVVIRAVPNHPSAASAPALESAPSGGWTPR